MATQKKIRAKSLTNEKMLRILLQEIADVRYELKQDILSLDQRLSGQINGLSLELKSFRLESHENQITFMKNHDGLEKRMIVIEAKCA